MVNGLAYGNIKFPVSKKVYGKIEEKIASASMCLVMKMVWFIQFMYLIKKSEDCMDLLLITDKNRSHYVYIEDFHSVMCYKRNIRIKNTFADICSALAVKES